MDRKLETNRPRPLLVVCFVLAAALLPTGAGAADALRPVTAAIPRHFPPHYRLDDKGRPAGFAIEVLEAVARRANLHVSYRIEEDWPAVMAAVRAGRADLIPNFGISAERRRDFAYSRVLETFPVAAMVRSENDDIRDADHLAGREVAVVAGNVAADLLRGRPGVTLAVRGGFEEALFALLSGNVDALVAPVPPILALAQAAGVRERIKVAGPPLIEIKRAMAVRKGDLELLERLNRAIEPFLMSAEYRDIYRRWYGAPEEFWTAARVAWIAGIVLAGAVFVLVAWRYRTVVVLNRELKAQLDELRRFQQATVARELRLKELRDENERLRAQIGRTAIAQEPHGE